MRLAAFVVDVAEVRELRRYDADQLEASLSQHHDFANTSSIFGCLVRRPAYQYLQDS